MKRYTSICEAGFCNLGAVHMRCGDFYLTFKWSFVSHVKKFNVFLEKDCFDDVFK